MVPAASLTGKVTNLSLSWSRVPAYRQSWADISIRVKPIDPENYKKTLRQLAIRKNSVLSGKQLELSDNHIFTTHN